MQSDYYEPFYFPMCKDITRQIYMDEELKKYISENNLYDLATSWNGAFLHQAFHFLKDVDWSDYNERCNSVLYSGLEAQTAQFCMAIFACCTGHYSTAIRELRNAIESSMLFFRFDYTESYRKMSGNEKMLEIMNLPENETFGKKVFTKSGYSKALDIYENVYRPLCRYTHTSISLDENSDIYEDYAFSGVYYNKKEVQRCLHYIQKVMLIEVDMMKEILTKVYGTYKVGYFDGIFDKLMIENPIKKP